MGGGSIDDFRTAEGGNFHDFHHKIKYMLSLMSVTNRVMMHCKRNIPGWVSPDYRQVLAFTHKWTDRELGNDRDLPIEMF